MTELIQIARDGGAWALVIIIVVGGGFWLTRWAVPKVFEEFARQRTALMDEIVAARAQFLAALKDQSDTHQREFIEQRNHDAERYESLVGELRDLAEAVRSLKDRVRP